MTIKFRKFQRLISVIMLALLTMGTATVSALAAEPVDNVPAENEVSVDVSEDEEVPPAAEGDDEEFVDADVDADDGNDEIIDLDQDEEVIESDDMDESDDDIVVSDDEDIDVVNDNDDDDLNSAQEEQTVEVAPAKVRAYSDNEEYTVLVSEDGTATIEGLLKAFTTGGTANETIEMLVNGEYYSFEVYSDGTVAGDLPEGFAVVDGKLVVQGYDDMDIYILDHKGASSTYEEPLKYGYIPAPEIPVVTATSSIYEPPVEGVRGGSNASATPALAAAVIETVAEEPAEEVVKTAEIAPVSFEDTEEQVLGAYEEDGNGGMLPLAAGIVLSIGAATGLGVLLKLKLFA